MVQMVPRHHTSPSTTARRLLRHLHPRRDTGTGSGQKVKLIGIRRLPRLRRPRLAAPHLASRAATKEAVEAAALPRAQYRKRLRHARVPRRRLCPRTVSNRRDAESYVRRMRRQRWALQPHAALRSEAWMVRRVHRGVATQLYKAAEVGHNVHAVIPGRGAAPQRHDPHLPTHAPPLRSFGPRLDALACGMGPSAEVTDSNVTAMAVRELLPSVLPARLDWFVLDVLRAPKWRYYATHGNACTRVCGLSKPQV